MLLRNNVSLRADKGRLTGSWGGGGGGYRSVPLVNPLVDLPVK